MVTPQLRQSLLFKTMTDSEINEALTTLKAANRAFPKHSRIFTSGDLTETMGIVLGGSVLVESNDLWGNRSVLSRVGVNQFFGETYAYLEKKPLLVDVTAYEDCTILFLQLSCLHDMTTHPSWLVKFLMNLLTVSSQKSLNLSTRSFHTSPKKIRDRVMSYLNTICLQTHRHDFHIPFDRQELADYLNVERSALSKELGKMQKDGLIRYHKNHFILLSKPKEKTG